MTACIEVVRERPQGISLLRPWNMQSEIDSLYYLHEETIGRIAGYATIRKRDIQSLTRDIYAHVETHAYDNEPPSLKDVCKALAVKAGIPSSDDKTVQRFYRCVISCRAYHENLSHRCGGRSGKVTITKEPEGLLHDTLTWVGHETSLELLMQVRKALEERLRELNCMN